MIKDIAGAIKEGFKFFAQWNKSKEKRRLRVAIEAAEKYIQVSEKFGEFKKIGLKEQTKLLRHYSRRFFHYN